MYSETETVDLVRGLSKKRLKVCIDQGWIIASIGDSGPAYADIDLARLHLICSLQDDLGVDQDLLGTMLSLLDQVYGLRHELKTILRAIDSEPEDIQARLISKIKANT